MRGSLGRRRSYLQITMLGMLAAPIICHGQGVITTYAGGTCCADPDGVAATSAYLQGADGLTVDSAGNLYIWEVQPFRVRKVNPAGIITTVAGVYHSFGSSGDGGPATSALLQGGALHPGLAMDSGGNLYISDGGNQRIRKVNPAGIIATVAGTGTAGFSGDGGLATDAMLADPNGIAVDAAGNLYIADSTNIRIRKVTPAGIISTVAGSGNVTFSGDGGPATNAGFERPRGVTVDSLGNLYISDGRRIRKVNTDGIISTVAGSANFGFSGDGGPATSAQLKGANGMAVDSAGNLYIADTTNQRIRKVDPAGIITTIAGTGFGFSGDGGPSTSAQLKTPHDVVFDAAGNLYISDTGNNRVRKIAASGPALLPNPSSLSFSYTIGGAAPAGQTVSVTSSGAALSFTVSTSESSGGNWLAVSPSSGTTPATLNVKVTATGLAAGTYDGTITLTPNEAGSTPQNVGVTLTVHGGNAPVFTSGGVVNALGYQNKLAPDTVFVIFGSGMGPASLASAVGPHYPTSVGGTSITFTPAAGGAAIDAKMVYSIAGQIAGLLPSSITPGTYAVRVTYKGVASAPQNVTVAARSFGIATANSAGTGTAQATIGNVNGGISLARFTSGSVTFDGLKWTLIPAHPGDTLVLWGTGGGADPANDNGGTSGDQTKAGNFMVSVGGRQIKPQYAGASSGFPGLWQINFTLPSDITPDCFASAQVTAGGELSNAVIIPIAAKGQSACSDDTLSQASLAKLDAGGSLTGGAFGVSKLTGTDTGTVIQTAAGAFYRWTAAEWAAGAPLRPKLGQCGVYDRTYPANGTDPANPDGALDAGASLPLTGPSLPHAGLAKSTIPTGPIYSLVPPAGALVAGKYTLAGLGGSEVGTFNVSSNFPATFAVTNWDAITTVDRTKPMTVNWTGSGIDHVTIQVNTTARVGSSNHIATLFCDVPGGPGTFSVPVAALSQLLPSATTAGLSVFGAPNPGTFTANLVSGGQTDFGVFSPSVGVSKDIAVH